MRVDKFFSSMGKLTRSDCQKAVKAGRITVNGQKITKADFKVDPISDIVCLDGEMISYKKYVYVVMNKPQGVVSATEDLRDKTLIDLLPTELRGRGLFPCGRLDKDTMGLVIMTDDGVSAHRALSPKKHVEKKYLFKTADPYSDEDAFEIEKGLRLKDGYITKPCKIERIDALSGYITLTEGKYHEIKRLFGARGNKIESLERISFGGISLKGLALGEWRFMTEEEEKIFTKNTEAT